jgi:hypothetical protein
MLKREGLPGPLHSALGLTVHDIVVTTVPPVIEEALEAALRASLGVARDVQLPWGRPPESTRSGR